MMNDSPRDAAVGSATETLESLGTRRPFRSREAYKEEVTRFWRNRHDYARTSGWLWSLYNRVLNGRFGRSLPLRHHVRSVYLRGIPEPFYLRLGTTDWLVLEELVVNKGYDRVFTEPIGPVRTIVDLGANIGMSVRLWKSHFPEARIVAVEPASGNLRVCRLNASSASLTDSNLQLIQACAAAAERTVFLDGRRGEWGTTMRDQPVGDASESVPALTVESICDRLGAGVTIDLLKCDVEGAEQEIFADCGHWLHRVRNLLIELHDPYSKDQFLRDLSNNGGRFRANVLEEGSGVMELFLTSESAQRP